MNPLDILNWCYYEPVRIEAEEQAKAALEAQLYAKPNRPKERNNNYNEEYYPEEPDYEESSFGYTNVKKNKSKNAT
jgi:hypothetical protein